MSVNEPHFFQQTEVSSYVESMACLVIEYKRFYEFFAMFVVKDSAETEIYRNYKGCKGVHRIRAISGAFRLILIVAKVFAYRSSLAACIYGVRYSEKRLNQLSISLDRPYNACNF